MKTTDAKFRRLLALLTADFVDAEADLARVERGETLPTIPTVYFLTDRDDNILYVGQTNKLRVRHAQHESNPRMSKVGWERVYWMAPQIKDRSKRLQIEAVLILLTLATRNQALFLVKRKKGVIDPAGQWVEAKFQRLKL